MPSDPSIAITLDPASAALLRAAPAWPAAVVDGLRRTLDLQNELTVGHIQAARMSQRGPETLGVVSNRLRLSLRPTKAVVTPEGLFSEIGSNVRYMAPHEFGFDGIVTVPEHQARHHALDVHDIGGGRTVKGWELAGSGARRSRVVAEGFVTVRQHTAHLKIPARAPIRRGIEDRLPDYRAAFSAAVVTALTTPPKSES